MTSAQSRRWDRAVARMSGAWARMRGNRIRRCSASRSGGRGGTAGTPAGGWSEVGSGVDRIGVQLGGGEPGRGDHPCLARSQLLLPLTAQFEDQPDGTAASVPIDLGVSNA